ncbi:phosphotransferase family protein [Streptomyces sp. NPDC020489]|uniref:phosphotransferase family protein n=1 Tax=Streptomyces sp. NPDC020489 TaxID=3365077 RepID=UPI0037AED29D
MLAPFFADDEFVRLAQRSSLIGAGHHHQNHVVRLNEPMPACLPDIQPGTPVLVRIPRPEAIPVVIRTWPDEAELLRSLDGRLSQVPKCLARTPCATVLSYTEGVPLSTPHPATKGLPRFRTLELASLLARTTTVPRDALPDLPAFWPRRDNDSRGFLHALVRLTDDQILLPNWPRYGALFTELGVPKDALHQLVERLPPLTDRPFGLVHGDLHRDNVVVTDARRPPLIAVDWELATFGDPLHDLAVHVVRMRYTKRQASRLIRAWTKAVEQVRAAATAGLRRDLLHYLNFERAQSVFPDVIRATQLLQSTPCDERTADLLMRKAVRGVRQALETAAAPLGLRRLPDPENVRDILHQWHPSTLCPSYTA